MSYELRDGEGPPRPRGRRPVTDYAATMINWLHNFRPSWENGYDGERERPHAAWVTKMVPPAARVACGVDTIPNKHLHSSLNKAKHPINVVRWTPEGRRLLTGSTSGEFTLWNGMGFNFETIMQAHDSAIRAAEWSSSGDWLVSADHDGVIKYWQSNFNNVQSIQGHDQPIRDLSFSPNDAKFVTASDDGTLKLFDFAGGIEEATFTGHGWDAKTVDWHPSKGLIVSGSKDHLVKLWDPRERRCLNTFHGHKNTITKVQFERTRGFCFASAARDQVARVFDLRLMRDIALLKGHEKDISTLTWHPIHPMLLTTGGHDGSIFHYLLDEQNSPDNQLTLSVWDHPEPETAPAQSIWPNHKVPFAHEMAVWTLDWHPVGHILASGSNDRITRFWTRARPGDDSWEKDRFHLGGDAADARDRRGAFDRARARAEEEQQQMEDEADALVDQNKQTAVPGLTALPPGLNLPGLAALDGTSLPSMPSLFNPPIPGSSQAHPPLGIPGMMPPPIPQAQGGSSAAPHFMPPPFPFPPPGMSLDPSRPLPSAAELADMMQRAGIPLPPPGALPPGIIPPPPPGFVPGLGAAPGQDTGSLPGAGAGSLGAGAGAESVRRRGPLPSQEESLKMEQSRGNYTRAR